MLRFAFGCQRTRRELDTMKLFRGQTTDKAELPLDLLSQMPSVRPLFANPADVFPGIIESFPCYRRP
jgi:hypothetical protein